MDINNLPKHIAIIPDGNRRWAKERNIPSFLGHKNGVDNAKRLAKKTRELGIRYFTGWMFSTENWLARSKEEMDGLFILVHSVVDDFKKQFMKDGTRFIHLGRKDRLPKDIIQSIKELEDMSKGNKEFTVAIAMDYGGRDEIIRATQAVISENLEITPGNIKAHLDTKDMPDPDLIIRTGFEKRLSGFMLWQSEYSEFYFPDCYFPDFTPDKLEQAIEHFSKVDRRFGGNTLKEGIS